MVCSVQKKNLGIAGDEPVHGLNDTYQRMHHWYGYKRIFRVKQSNY